MGGARFTPLRVVCVGGTVRVNPARCHTANGILSSQCSHAHTRTRRRGQHDRLTRATTSVAAAMLYARPCPRDRLLRPATVYGKARNIPRSLIQTPSSRPPLTKSKSTRRTGHAALRRRHLPVYPTHPTPPARPPARPPAAPLPPPASCYGTNFTYHIRIDEA